MIDSFLGIDTEGGDTGHYGFCHKMRHAVMIQINYEDMCILQFGQSQ